MTEFNIREKKYAKFWSNMETFLKNRSGFKICGISRAGSRRKMQHHTKSDLDIIFCIAGDPKREEVYPQLVQKIKGDLNYRADIGASKNVINIWGNRISCDLVLLSQKEFRKELDDLRNSL